jgi:hypothetical protein
MTIWKSRKIIASRKALPDMEERGNALQDSNPNSEKINGAQIVHPERMIEQKEP